VRCLAAFVFLALSAVSLAKAKDDPVQWTLAPANGAGRVAPGSAVTLDLKATIQPGWHLYSPTTPPGGPIITRIRLNPNPNIASYQVYRPQPVRKLDPSFNVDTETYAGQAVFLIAANAAKSASGSSDVAAVVRYQACSDTRCLNPVQKTATAHLTFVAGAPAASSAIPTGYGLVPAAAVSAPASPASSAVPVQPSGTGFAFLLTAFGFGVAALFTPCVFPMIPITVSFFLNQNQTDSADRKRNGWLQALVFCLGIIVLFTGLGLLATAIAGPFGVVQLGSSPWVNGFIALVFFIFGLSLLGAFELRLPSGLLTRLSSASQGGGYGGALLMGLTFSLTSFACIGPIVGPLLVASVQSKGAPILEMLAFAAGLAAPFFLLALFPSYLQRLPRSGMWMVRVKIVLGFIVLAVMLKYLSNIDQVLQTHWLTRERFLAAWIVLFALPGLYLLGLIPMEGIKREDRLGVARALLACLFLIFSLSLVPGLFGGRLGDLDAYIPESSGGVLNATGAQSEAGNTTEFKNALPAALTAARQQNKLVLIDFTGYACTNCHWMNANMFPRPEIQAAMKNLIRVDLYTDGTDAESQKNQQLEDKKFNTASIPFYALVDPDENVIATFPQLTRNPQEFLAFLESKPGSDRTATAMLR
jgi:thiol:disulfide interchange protein